MIKHRSPSVTNKKLLVEPNQASKVEDEYRPNVAMVVIKKGRILLLERTQHHNSWQLPQGGIEDNESAEKAMWRELEEETGIGSQHAIISARSQGYLSYKIPAKYRRKGKVIKGGDIIKGGDTIKGQKQIWFLLKLTASDKVIHFNNMEKPEFQRWCWAPYWSAIHQAFYFKRDVYRRGLLELLPAALKLGI